jgi:hypothetical protein
VLLVSAPQVQLWDLRKAGGVKSLGACGAHQGQVICTLPLTRPLHQRQRQQQLVSPATGTPPGTLQVVQGAAGAAGARVEAAQLLLNPVAPHLLGVVGHTEVRPVHIHVCMIRACCLEFSCGALASHTLIDVGCSSVN